MITQKLLSKLRRGITDFNMIADGDKVAVGLSGGKDSVTLLRLLADYRRFSPQKFELIAITVDLAFHGVKGNYQPLIELCKELDVPYFIEYTQIGEIVFDIRKESNPCSLCSKMRKGALYEVAVREKCNKIALGHHSDDLIGTYFLSMFYEGRLSTFAPTAYLSRTNLTLIRPMLYLNESEIKTFSESAPVVKSKCPADKNTKRETVKQIIANIEKDVPELKKQVFTALLHPDRYNLFDKYIPKNKTEEE